MKRGKGMSHVYRHYSAEPAAGAESEEIESFALLSFSEIADEKGDAETHLHPYTEIFVFEEGAGRAEIGRETVALRAGDVLIVREGREHRQYSAENETLRYCCFAAAFHRGGAAVAPERGFALLHCGEKIAPFVAACKKEFEEKKRGCSAAVGAYFKLMLVEFMRFLYPDGASVLRQTPQTPVGRVKIYLDEHVGEDISIDELCRRFFISKSNLLHAFKREFGISPARYRNVKKIESAKKHLEAGSSVTDAALRAGFDNPVYFAEIFRRYTGLAPSAYKKMFAAKKRGE